MTQDNLDRLAEKIREYVARRDLLLFSGPIDDNSCDKLRELVLEGNGNSCVSLFLTTFGGDLHAAYRMVRCLQGSYKDIRLLIVGRCKSAGTLVAVGSNSLAFGSYGELGPLDAQISKPDELLFHQSGLDVLQAFEIITANGWEKFTSYVVELGRAGLSTRSASHIAAELAGRFTQPVAEQIDPLRLAEATRTVQVATHYGERLNRGNLKTNALRQLVNEYSSHSFVVDRTEAEGLFNRVHSLDDTEQEILELLSEEVKCLRYPSTTIVVENLGAKYCMAAPEVLPEEGGTENVNWEGTEEASGEGSEGSYQEPEVQQHEAIPATNTSG